MVMPRRYKVFLVVICSAVSLLWMIQNTPSSRYEPVSSRGTSLTVVISPIVHLIWCKRALFQFQHFMSVKSIIKYIGPKQIVFHYDVLPTNGGHRYYLWFEDLKNEVKNLTLKRMEKDNCTDYVQNIKLMRDGIYVPIDIIITQPIASIDQAHISAKLSETFDANVNLRYFYDTIFRCKTVNAFNEGKDKLKNCIIISYEIKPMDIRFTESRFHSFCRNLLYQSDRIPEPRHDIATASPRQVHLIFIGKWNINFQVYLTLLSDLYVAEFDKVFIHSTEEPYGHYWNTINNDSRVVWVELEKPAMFFGHLVANSKYESSILRLKFLEKYGGAYRDSDVIWTRRVPDSLFAYDAVLGYDWIPEEHWPDKYNNGCFFGKKGAFFLTEWLRRYKTHRGRINGYNALLCPVKINEDYPGSLFVDRYLQVICYYGVCHPPWIPNYQSTIKVNYDVGKWDWNETLSVHINQPKAVAEFESEEALRNAKGLYADIGRNVIRKSQRLI